MNYRNMSDIGARVKMMREKRRFSMAALGKICKIAPSSISYMERGTYLPPLAKLQEIAKALECDTEWLLTGHENYETEIKKILKIFDALTPQQQNDLLLLLNYRTKPTE